MKKTGYQVDDRWFDKKSDAAAYMAETRLQELVNDCPRGTAGEIKDWMIAQEWRLVGLLSDVARRGVRLARAASQGEVA